MIFKTFTLKKEVSWIILILCILSHSVYAQNVTTVSDSLKLNRDHTLPFVKDSLYGPDSLRLPTTTTTTTEEEPPSLLEKLVPPSPNAAALGKYGDVPVSMYTGVPNISIPLWELKGRKLSLPISLSYHSSGIRVNEAASWVGLGWVLNAGGAITRTMRGLPDEFGPGYKTGYLNLPPEYKNMPTNQADLFTWSQALYGEDQADLYEIASGDKDTKPDIYNFNFAGKSGKFVFDPYGNTHSIPQQKIDIDGYPGPVGGGSFTITTEDGTIYTFSDIEESNTQTFCSTIDDFLDFNSTWYLTKIEDANQTEEINFFYEDETIIESYSSGHTEHRLRSGTGYLGGNCENDMFSYCSNDNTTQVKRLRRIEIPSTQQRIDFFPKSTNRADLTGTSKAIDRICIYSNGQKIKEFDLDNDAYFGSGSNPEDKRLKLSGLTEKSKNGTAKPPYIFEYNPTPLPRRYANRADHWGYFNGTNSTTPLPTVELPGNVIWAGADKEPDCTNAQAGILTKIHYPTGGTSEFTYECHDYGFDHTLRPLSEPVTFVIATSIIAENPNSLPPPNISTKTITLDFQQEVTLYYKVEPHTLDCDAYVALKTSSGTQIIYKPCQLNGVVNEGYETISVPAGTYTLEARAEWPNDYVFATLYWQEQEVVNGTPLTNKVFPSGGLRIQQINSQANSDSPPLTKQYVYRMEEETDRSSGTLFQKYLYNEIVTIFQKVPPDPKVIEAYNVCTYYKRSSSNILPSSLTHGSHIGYKEVLELHGPNGNKGSKRYKYKTNPFDAGSWEPPFAPLISYDYRRGLEDEIITYNADGDKVEKVQLDYTFEPKTLIPSFVVGFKVSGLYPNGILSNYDLFNIETSGVYSQWFYLNQRRVTKFGPNESNPVTTTFNYYYDNAAHKQLTRSEQINSDGIVHSTRVTYPEDYACFSNLQSNQKSANSNTAYCPTYALYENDSNLPGLTKVSNYVKAGEDIGVPGINGMVNVQPNQDVTFEAGSSITLDPGFFAKHNSTFEATIETCSSSNQPPDPDTPDPQECATTICQMIEKHMHNYPIESQTLRNSQLTKGEVNLYKNFGIGGGGIHLEQQYQLETSTPITSPNVSTTNSTGVFQFNNNYTPYFSVDYDVHGNIINYQETKDAPSKLIWDPNTNSLPIAKIVNPDPNGNCGTESQCTFYEYNTPFRQPTRITEVTDPSQLTNSSQTNIPYDSGTSTYYSYDEFGRLKTIRDDDSNILKTYEYNYK